MPDVKSNLPKVELIEGEIDYPEMIKSDYRKALLIFLLSFLTTAVITISLWALKYFL